jgi:hypothetical protein
MSANASTKTLMVLRQNSPGFVSRSRTDTSSSGTDRVVCAPYRGRTSAAIVQGSSSTVSQALEHHANRLVA